MMDSRIEAYFGKTLTADEKRQFEKEIRENPGLAQDVAFYLAAHKAQADGRREEILNARHAEWQQLLEEDNAPRILNRWWAAAAAVLALVIGITWYFNSASLSYQKQAHEYVATRFQTVNVQMGGQADTLQAAVKLFNLGDLKGARQITDHILSVDPENAEAKKMAGIVSLRLDDYDKAIEHFHELGSREELFSNPGKFYEALALLERNESGDKEKAEVLLKEVLEKTLEGHEEVEKWNL